MNSKIKILFILSFLTVQNVSAVEIEVSSVHPQSYFVQVGAFKNLSNIQKVKDRLFEYDIYLEAHKNMQRIHVVNILAPSLKGTLVKIRKIYPKAFISKRPSINSAQADYIQKPSPSFNNIKSYEPSLDSNTILKTRKSFL